MVAHVHLHEAALHQGVAWSRSWPSWSNSSRGLFTGVDIDLKPVLDLADQTRVTAFTSTPRDGQANASLRTVGDVFPTPPASPAPSTSTTLSNTSTTALRDRPVIATQHP